MLKRPSAGSLRTKSKCDVQKGRKTTNKHSSAQMMYAASQATFCRFVVPPGAVLIRRSAYAGSFISSAGSVLGRVVTKDWVLDTPTSNRCSGDFTALSRQRNT